jgi:hypothetical protein
MPIVRRRLGEWIKSTETVSKLREILRPAARSEDFDDFFVSGRSQEKSDEQHRENQLLTEHDPH